LEKIGGKVGSDGPEHAKLRRRAAFRLASINPWPKDYRHGLPKKGHSRGLSEIYFRQGLEGRLRIYCLENSSIAGIEWIEGQKRQLIGNCTNIEHSIKIPSTTIIYGFIISLGQCTAPKKQKQSVRGLYFWLPNGKLIGLGRLEKNDLVLIIKPGNCWVSVIGIAAHCDTGWKPPRLVRYKHVTNIPESLTD
jgi:hypothetical protein